MLPLLPVSRRTYPSSSVSLHRFHLSTLLLEVRGKEARSSTYCSGPAPASPGAPPRPARYANVRRRVCGEPCTRAQRATRGFLPDKSRFLFSSLTLEKRGGREQGGTRTNHVLTRSLARSPPPYTVADRYRRSRRTNRKRRLLTSQLRRNSSFVNVFFPVVVVWRCSRRSYRRRLRRAVVQVPARGRLVAERGRKRRRRRERRSRLDEGATRSSTKKVVCRETFDRPPRTNALFEEARCSGGKCADGTRPGPFSNVSPRRKPASLSSLFSPRPAPPLSSLSLSLPPPPSSPRQPCRSRRSTPRRTRPSTTTTPTLSTSTPVAAPLLLKSTTPHSDFST